MIQLRSWQIFYLQSTRSNSDIPNTVVVLLPEFSPPTVAPSVAEARCALQCALMDILPATLTLPLKQYQPLGFNNENLVIPITLTPGLT